MGAVDEVVFGGEAAGLAVLGGGGEGVVEGLGLGEVVGLEQLYLLTHLFDLAALA